MATDEEGTADVCMSVAFENTSEVCDVLISTETTADDVIACLRPTEDKSYCLVENWKGCERPINKNEKLQSVLLQWGSDLDDVTFILKEKISTNLSQSTQAISCAVPAAVNIQDHLIEQQKKVEHMERELQEKEQYLQTLRLKEAEKNGLKTNYVRRLEARVIEQEQQLRRLRRFEQELFKYHIENEKLALELHRARAMLAQKQQELVEATARVELLSRELSLKQRGEVIDQQLATLQGDEQIKSNEVAQHETVPPSSQHVRILDPSVTSHEEQPTSEREVVRLKDQILQNQFINKARQVQRREVLDKTITHQLNDTESLLSWQDDDENDTETSADSGHVSVDSPSFQTGNVGGTNFQFNIKQQRYNGKVERFDMDLEYISLKQGSAGISDRDGPRWGSLPTRNKPHLQHGSFNGVPASTDFKQPLFVQTDVSRTRNSCDSPNSISSQSSQNSVSSASEQRVTIPVASQSESSKDRTDGSIARLRKHNTGRSSPQVNQETKTEAMITNNQAPTLKRTDSNSPTPKARSGKSTMLENTTKQKQPVTSVGIQDLLDEVPGLKISARDSKALQIQTVAEKDSGNQTQEAESKKQGTNGKKTTPRPVPRKRTKPPPPRSIVVTSMVTTERVLTPTSETVPNMPEQMVVNRPMVKENIRSTKTRKNGSNDGKNRKRVSLDPHAVLLHASLDGELDVIKSVIHQVEDPSFPNTEGLTALHHAVCNNHKDIVTFLVEYGCDINAADMQGWTSLHCAAANNSVDICKYLVNHGACVFAVTVIEGKTPSRCCEKDSANYKECYAYLSDLENSLGVMSEGVVYAVYAYQASRKDELSFECGESLTVIRRGDVTEKEWWWARDSQGRLGYIPRNLLGLCPRIAPDV